MDSKPFIHDDFLLTAPESRRLFHEFAADQPICDYHCHLEPQKILDDHRFPTLTAAWLDGDHYKWRAMRTMGVPERLISGDGPADERFDAWAAVVPSTIRNPLFHWTHLELARYFDESRTLSLSNSKEIFAAATARLESAQGYGARGLLRQMNVRTVVTTEDPTDDLVSHRMYAQIREANDPVMLPAFRPDRALAIDGSERFCSWIDALGAVCGHDIDTLDALIRALESRHDYFADMGCTIADYGLDRAYGFPSNHRDANRTFQKMRTGDSVAESELDGYRAFVLIELLRMHGRDGWVQQLHLGASRDSNSRGVDSIGQAAGFDSIGDGLQVPDLVSLLDHLERQGSLAKTILYCLNPRDNEAFASIAGSFQSSGIQAKVQLGSGWWFNDTLNGMTRQIEALSSIGLLAPFVGMLTDSRSFLSFPRHEYFRRLLSDILGRDMAAGLLPHDYRHIGGILRDICYFNAAEYFGFNGNGTEATDG